MVRRSFVGFAAFALGLLSSADARADSFRGVVHSPPGEPVLGQVVLLACWAPEGRCLQEHPRTRAIHVTSRSAAQANFVIGNVAPGSYFVIAFRDVNGSDREDDGDWTGDVLGPDGVPVVVRSGASVEVRMRAIGAQAPAVAQTRASGSKAAPPPAPSKAGGLKGLFIGVTRQLVAPGPGSLVEKGITWTPSRDWFALFPDGRAIVGLPEEGLRSPVDWSQCGENFLYCPTYSRRGKKVVFRWASGETKEYALDGNGMLLHSGLNWIPLGGLDGLKLEGRYVSIGNEYRKGWIAFRRDGRFEEQLFLPDIAWREIGSFRDLTEQERRGGTGTYSIAQNTIELRYSDGRVVRTSVYAFPEDARQSRPPKLYFRGWDYHLQQ